MKQVFIPGEVITTEEEFGAGKQAYEDNGLIKASVLGEAVFDDLHKEVSIKGRQVSVVGNDDIVFGRVTFVKDNVAVVTLVRGENGKKVIVTKGQIPARNVAGAYVSSVKKYFKIGDFVKARVVSNNGSALDLETKGKGLGVILAYCSQCRSEMKYSNEKLVCFGCGHVEQRKWVDQEFKRDPNFKPRSNSFSRGRSNNYSGGRSNHSGDRRSYSNDRNGRSNDRNNRSNNSDNNRTGSFRGGRR
jgi:exosome complex component CSL4